MNDVDEKLPIPGETYNAWAIWNCCQGVFTDAVFHWREEALDVLPKYGEGAKVVPVTVTVDLPDKWAYRHWDQDEWEKLHQRGRFATPMKSQETPRTKRDAADEPPTNTQQRRGS